MTVRVRIHCPLWKDLHGRRGTLRGAEEVELPGGFSLGVLFDVEVDELGPFWLPREAVRLDTKP